MLDRNSSDSMAFALVVRVDVSRTTQIKMEDYHSLFHCNDHILGLYSKFPSTDGEKRMVSILWLFFSGNERHVPLGSNQCWLFLW